MKENQPNKTNGSNQENPQDSLILATRLLAFRKSLGMSQADLSAEIKVSQGYLSQLENGEHANPNIRIAVGIAQAFGTGLNIFQGEKDNWSFLRPQTKRLVRIIETPQLEDGKREAITTATRKLIPQLDAKEDLKYVDGKLISGKEIGEAIQIRRSILEMKQGELSSLTSLSQGYTSQLESGGVPYPSVATLYKIAEALQTNIYNLLGFQEKNYPEEIELFDQFIRSNEFTQGQKKVILDRFVQVLAMIVPIVNRIDPIPQIEFK